MKTAEVDEIELHENLAIGYEQALKDEGVSPQELIERFKILNND